MQHHRVSMLEPELLPGEVADGREHLLGWRAGRHREDQLVDQLRCGPPIRSEQIRPLSIFVQVQVPIVDQKPPNAPADPWNAATLEWSIPSPPQEFNFAVEPTVHGRDALWELKRAAGGTVPEPQRVSGAGVHMPNPSFWPAVAALGVATTLIGFIGGLHLPVTITGVVILFIGVYSWAFEPAG